MKPLKAPVLYGDQGTNGRIKETCIEPECHRQWDQTGTGIVPSKIGRARIAPGTLGARCRLLFTLPGKRTLLRLGSRKEVISAEVSVRLSLADGCLRN